MWFSIYTSHTVPYYMLNVSLRHYAIAMMLLFKTFMFVVIIGSFLVVIVGSFLGSSLPSNLCARVLS